MNQEVLVLNSDYEPLNVCNMRRAIVLLRTLAKADVLHVDGEIEIVQPIKGMIMPSVVKLRSHVKRPLPELKLSRRTVFARDNYMCQYCGSTTKGSDYRPCCIPKRHGGKASWENLVCCCRRCNHEKERQAGASGWHEIGAASSPSTLCALY